MSDTIQHHYSNHKISFYHNSCETRQKWLTSPESNERSQLQTRERLTLSKGKALTAPYQNSSPHLLPLPGLPTPSLSPLVLSHKHRRAQEGSLESITRSISQADELKNLAGPLLHCQQQQNNLSLRAGTPDKPLFLSTANKNSATPTHSIVTFIVLKDRYAI